MQNEQDAARDGGLRAQISVRQVVRDQMTGGGIPDGLSSAMPDQPLFSSSDPDVQYDVGVICCVRTEEDKSYSDRYVETLENSGLRVFYPPRDTDQVDPGGGLRILRDNYYRGFLRCREIHIVWDPKSQGSVFDLGLCFAMRKPLRVVNPVRRTHEKSFANAILDWQAGKLGIAEQAIYTIEYDGEIDPR